MELFKIPCIRHAELDCGGNLCWRLQLTLSVVVLDLNCRYAWTARVVTLTLKHYYAFSGPFSKLLKIRRNDRWQSTTHWDISFNADGYRLIQDNVQLWADLNFPPRQLILLYATRRYSQSSSKTWELWNNQRFSSLLDFWKFRRRFFECPIKNSLVLDIFLGPIACWCKIWIEKL